MAKMVEKWAKSGCTGAAARAHTWARAGAHACALTAPCDAVRDGPGYQTLVHAAVVDNAAPACRLRGRLLRLGHEQG